MFSIRYFFPFRLYSSDARRRKRIGFLRKRRISGSYIRMDSREGKTFFSISGSSPSLFRHVFIFFFPLSPPPCLRSQGRRGGDGLSSTQRQFPLRHAVSFSPFPSYCNSRQRCSLKSWENDIMASPLSLGVFFFAQKLGTVDKSLRYSVVSTPQNIFSP